MTRAPSGALLRRVLKVLPDIVATLSEGQLHSLGGDPAQSTQEIGEMLRRYRSEHGISQRHLAKLLQVNPNTIVLWELNRRVPRGEFLQRVRAVVGTTGLLS